MDVLLVVPPRRARGDHGFTLPPLGLASVAASLARAGHRVRILDARALGLPLGAVEARLARWRPDVVGVTAMTPTADLAAGVLRAARPWTRHLVLGGPHPSALRERVLADLPGLDVAVVGEAEESAPEALDWLARGARGRPPDGVVAPGRPFKPRPPPDDLDRLPRPARHLLPAHRYRYAFATRPGLATLSTSRGCPHGCAFCDQSVSGTRWRARSGGDAADEVASLAAEGVGFVVLVDDDFTRDRARVEAFCDTLLSRRVDVAWKCEARVDEVDATLLRRMHRAGCRVVAFGVESASPATLARLGKGFGPGRIRAALAEARAAGLRTVVYALVGAPGEGPAEARATVDLCIEAGADWAQFSTLSLLPGSRLARAGAEPTADVRHFLDADRTRATLTDLPAEALDRAVRAAWRRFWMRPGPVISLTAAAVSSDSLPELARLGAAWARWTLPGPGVTPGRPAASETPTAG